jgi:hypothetical protein
MNNLKAPLTVLAIGSAWFTLIGEPGGIILVATIALLGYQLNKKENH